MPNETRPASRMLQRATVIGFLVVVAAAVAIALIFRR